METIVSTVTSFIRENKKEDRFTIKEVASSINLRPSQVRTVMQRLVLRGRAYVVGRTSNHENVYEAAKPIISSAQKAMNELEEVVRGGAKHDPSLASSFHKMSVMFLELASACETVSTRLGYPSNSKGNHPTAETLFGIH